MAIFHIRFGQTCNQRDRNKWKVIVPILNLSKETHFLMLHQKLYPFHYLGELPNHFCVENDIPLVTIETLLELSISQLCFVRKFKTVFSFPKATATGINNWPGCGCCADCLICVGNEFGYRRSSIVTHSSTENSLEKGKFRGAIVHKPLYCRSSWLVR